MTAKTESEVSELACTYAALILHDDNVPITADKISNLLKAANVQYQAFWPTLFARVLANRNLDDLILSAGGGGGAAAPAASGGGAPAPAAAEEKKEEKGGKKGGEPKKEEKKKKEEPKEEEGDEDMGFGLFD